MEKTKKISAVFCLLAIWVHFHPSIYLKRKLKLKVRLFLSLPVAEMPTKYGIRWKANEWEFHFVSYAKQKFTLRQTGDDLFKVYTRYNNKEIEVTRIFVQIEGGSFWVPSIPYVMLTGVDIHTGRKITETIIP